MTANYEIDVYDPKSIIYAIEGEARDDYQWRELGATDGDPCREWCNRIDRLIGLLKTTRKEIQQLSTHRHKWNDDDYCSICRLDGRA